MLVFTSGSAPVGDEADAARAARGELRSLGHGLFKTVYASSTGDVVYKTARIASCDGYGETRATNVMSEAAWAAKGHMEGTPGIPDVSVYVVDGRPVLAMPYFPFEQADYGASVIQTPEAQARMATRRQAWYDLGLSDLHSENYRFDASGDAWVTDLGGWSHLPDGIDLPDSLTSARDSSVGSEPCEGCEECDNPWDNDDDDEPYCDECEDWHEPCSPPTPPRDSQRPVQMTWGLGVSREFPIYAASRDKCGLRERMRQGTDMTFGIRHLPTCGHPSRHPSRKPMSARHPSLVAGQLRFEAGYRWVPQLDGTPHTRMAADGHITHRPNDEWRNVMWINEWNAA